MQHTERKANEHMLVLYVVHIRPSGGYRPALTKTNLIWKLDLEHHKSVLVWIVLLGTTELIQNGIIQGEIKNFGLIDVTHAYCTS